MDGGNYNTTHAHGNSDHKSDNGLPQYISVIDDDDSVPDDERPVITLPIELPPTDPFKRLAYDLGNLFNIRAYSARSLLHDYGQVTFNGISLSLLKRPDGQSFCLSYKSPGISEYNQDITLPPINSDEWHDMISTIAERYLSRAFESAHNSLGIEAEPPSSPTDTSEKDEAKNEAQPIAAV